MSTKPLKTLVTISLLLLTVTVLSIFGSILIVNQRDKQTKNVSASDADINNPLVQQTPKTATLTAEIVAQHNSKTDCWIIISNNVYGVSSYLTAHPAGAGAITPYCGKDATSAFSSRGGSGSHSSNAYSLLGNYLIGSLGTTTTIASLPSAVTSSPTNNTSNTSNSGALPSSVSSKYPGATISKQEIEDDGRQELKIFYNGSCIKIKLNSSGSITKEEGC